MVNVKTIAISVLASNLYSLRSLAADVEKTIYFMHQITNLTAPLVVCPWMTKTLQNENSHTVLINVNELQTVCVSDV